jgi:hypothetical protein
MGYARPGFLWGHEPSIVVIERTLHLARSQQPTIVRQHQTWLIATMHFSMHDLGTA